MYQNATREQIENALRAGQSVAAINRELRADRARIRRIRDELGIDTYVPAEQTRTVEEKWAESTRPADDGHVEWTGSRGNTSGTPIMRHQDKSHSPAAVAFRIRTGRDGKGHVFADCGMRHCVAPEHVKDEAERNADREALRSEAAPQACRYGHDRGIHGRFTPDGRSYCARCNWLAKNPDQDDRDRQPVPQSPEDAFRLHTRETDDGHVLWTGPNYRGRPGLPWRGTTLSPARIAFRLHHGREPEGIVTAACTVPQCVAGPCMRDEPMRLTSPEEAFRLHTRETDGGHVLWTGPNYRGRPGLASRGTSLSPARIAFRLHHGHEPEGIVTAACTVPRCLAGPCLRDEPMRSTSPEEAFRQHVREADGGHVLWTGPNYRNGLSLPWRGTSLSPARIAFRLHHGREPQGNVTAACTVPRCVAGPCMQDRPMRQKADQLYKSIFGTAA